MNAEEEEEEEPRDIAGERRRRRRRTPRYSWGTQKKKKKNPEIQLGNEEEEDEEEEEEEEESEPRDIAGERRKRRRRRRRRRTQVFLPRWMPYNWALEAAKGLREKAFEGWCGLVLREPGSGKVQHGLSMNRPRTRKRGKPHDTWSLSKNDISWDFPEDS